MSSLKTKTSREIKIDNEVNKLRRKPLYPELDAEKENVESLSSDHSPEKFPHGHYPKVTRKKADSIQHISSNPKHRNTRHQQKQMDNSQDSENSEMDMERDNLINEIICTQKQEPEISPNLSPESYRCENSKDSRRLIQPAIQPQTVEPLDSASNFSCFFSKISIYLILSCIILLICIPISISWPKSFVTPYMNDRFNVSILVNSLKAEFQNQPPLTFRIIYSAIRNVLEVQPTAPAIILLLATNGSETVCSEFAGKLIHLLSVPKYTVNISGKDCKKANTNHVKKEIDEAISNNLVNDQLGSVLIHNLDQIPGQAAMIFHKYCDHENAPFKKAVFVMTVNYNKVISDYSNIKVWDKAANDHLLSVWTDIGVDQVTPLLARLTVSVAVIKA